MKDNPEMPSSEEDHSQFVKNSVLYKEFLAERAEILKHKWIESEKAGKDIGFEKALLDWIVKHRSHWRERRMKEARTEKAASCFLAPLKRSCEVAKDANERDKTEPWRPNHGRRSDPARAVADRARNY